MKIISQLPNVSQLPLFYSLSNRATGPRNWLMLSVTPRVWQVLGSPPYAEVTMGLRERKKLATRHRIVDVALERFAENGYDVTTVEEIANDAEVSVTTFFRYFRSKEEVLFIDAEWTVPDFCAALEARPTHEPDLEAIHQVLRMFRVREVHGDERQRRLRQHRVVADTPVLRGRAHLVAQRWQREVAAVLAKRPGTFPGNRNVRLTAAIAFTIVSFADDEWCAHEGAVDWLTILDEAFDSHAALTPSGLDP